MHILFLSDNFPPETNAPASRLYEHASHWVRRGHQVTVIDQDVSAFDSLPVDFHGRTIKGDVLARNVLHLAEIDEAEALAAVSDWGASSGWDALAGIGLTLSRVL